MTDRIARVAKGDVVGAGPVWDEGIGLERRRLIAAFALRGWFHPVGTVVRRAVSWLGSLAPS